LGLRWGCLAHEKHALLSGKLRPWILTFVFAK